MTLGIVLGILGSQATLLPGRHFMNGGLMAGNVAALAYYLVDPAMNVGMSMLGTTSALSMVMGVTLTMAIGGQ